MHRLSMLVLATLVVLSTHAARAQSITGEAHVVSGDTIEIRGQVIRLQGVDAPESKQTCDRDGDKWLCAADANAKLRELIGSDEVRCEKNGREARGRYVGVCAIGGRDLGAEMVASGLALAYRSNSEAYVSQEEEAKAAKRGLWAGAFIEPWEWRKGKRLESENVSMQPPGCPIKGDITAKGERIYHMPGGAQYRTVNVDTAVGERWFCNEEEAKKAGWKRAPQ